MVARFRTATQGSFALTVLWHKLIVTFRKPHRGIVLMRFDGKHTSRWNTRPVVVLKF